MRETYKKTILQRHVAKEKLAGKTISWRSVLAAARIWASGTLMRPFQMLFTEPIVMFLSLYVGFDFAVLYAFFASLPLVFEETYGFNVEQVGLVFISLGVGTLLATLTGVLCDWFIYQRKSKIAMEQTGCRDLPPEQRLYPAMMGSLGVATGLFWFAWTARTDVHWISPVLALLPFNWGNLCIFVGASPVGDVFQHSLLTALSSPQQSYMSSIATAHDMAPLRALQTHLRDTYLQRLFPCSQFRVGHR